MASSFCPNSDGFYIPCFHGPAQNLRLKQLLADNDPSVKESDTLPSLEHPDVPIPVHLQPSSVDSTLQDAQVHLESTHAASQQLKWNDMGTDQWIEFTAHMASLEEQQQQLQQLQDLMNTAAADLASAAEHHPSL